MLEVFQFGALIFGVIMLFVLILQIDEEYIEIKVFLIFFMLIFIISIILALFFVNVLGINDPNR